MTNHYFETAANLPLNEEQTDWLFALHNWKRQVQTGQMTLDQVAAGAPQGVREALEQELADYEAPDIDEPFEEWHAIDETGQQVGIWFHSLTVAPEYLGLLIAATWMQFQIERPFALIWAEYADKPLAGEFGAGAMIITKEQIHAQMDVRLWAQDQLAELGQLPYPEEQGQ